MAEIYPSLEEASDTDHPKKEGEMCLLRLLQQKLPNNCEVYYKPIFNGEIIDVVVLLKGCGIALISVRDWNLQEVALDDEGQWTDRVNGRVLIAPDRQVDGYKWNMFNLHISGLAEKAALNENFRKVVHPFVFFHQSTKKDINELFDPLEKKLRQEKMRVNKLRGNGDINARDYDVELSQLERKSNRLGFSKRVLVTEETHEKIAKALRNHVLFVDGIYEAFIEYLRPRYHHIKDGEPTKFVGKQIRLIKSKPGFQKIKGVAGSGKTTMLATRAVGSHLRHGGKVLILTFNKTLRNFVRSRVEAVPEDFDTGSIIISNYHSFLNMNLKHCGLPVSPPDGQDKAAVEKHFDSFYSNERMFLGVEEMLFQYDSIFLDEIQDYQTEWIKIIRKYFLKEGGEMVLYGDEGQNIYERDLKGPKSVIVQGFGSWERLTRSMRSEVASPLAEMTKCFHERYLLPKYDVDLMETQPVSGLLSLDAPTVSFYKNESPTIHQIVRSILELQSKRIAIEDITVICSNIEILRKCEKELLKDHSIRAITTFESEKNFVDLERKYREPEFSRKIKDIRGSKKFSFDQSSPCLKLSTVHSFKGMESNTVLFIVVAEDSEEILYTGMTRAKQYLALQISQQSQFVEFFETQPNVVLEDETQLLKSGLEKRV